MVDRGTPNIHRCDNCCHTSGDGHSSNHPGGEARRQGFKELRNSALSQQMVINSSNPHANNVTASPRTHPVEPEPYPEENDNVWLLPKPRVNSLCVCVCVFVLATVRVRA